MRSGMFFTCSRPHVPGVKGCVPATPLGNLGNFRLLAHSKAFLGVEKSVEKVKKSRRCLYDMSVSRRKRYLRRYPASDT